MGFSRSLPIVAVSLGLLFLAVRATDARAGEPSPGVVPDGTSGPVQAPLPGVGQRASGAVFIGYRGTDGETTGAVATLAPLPRTFLRVGAEVTPRSWDGAARFLWGLGLEEPRDRTLFLRVEDWGPVRVDRSFTLRHAEARLGYKLPALRGGPFRVATSALAALPFDGGPYVAARAAVTAWRTWFVATEFGWTVPGALPGAGDAPPWRLSVALGRWDGRPGGLFVTYRDELSTRQYADWSRIDRQGRGVLALGVSWAR